jgi:protein-S-isoprenylcysteine O-methyltransferase Ste14
MRLAFKSIFFTIALPGVVILLVPYILLWISGPIPLPDLSLLRILSTIFWFISVLVLLYCIWDFAWYGGGTLAPVVPPKRLVVHGFYRYTRNPMYVAVFGALLSEAIFFGSLKIFVYALIVGILFHLFVVFYEEPRLNAEFGVSYEAYRKLVPRWGITKEPYSPDRNN